MKKIKSVESLRTFLESVPESEVLKGKDFWEEVKKKFSGDSAFISFMDIAVEPNIDSVTGGGFSSYIKALLTEFINSWLFYQDRSKKDLQFFPEDLMRVIYILLTIIKKQDTTLKNILEIQNKENNKES